ncbi:MAG: BolA family protein [Kiloniellales bacterium]
MTRAKRIEMRLTEALKPRRLTVVDRSEAHRGHAGWRPSGETHFKVEVESRAFEGLSRVARQRLVYDLLRGELEGGLHALELTTRIPGD